MYIPKRKQLPVPTFYYKGIETETNINCLQSITNKLC